MATAFNGNPQMVQALDGGPTFKFSIKPQEKQGSCNVVSKGRRNAEDGESKTPSFLYWRMTNNDGSGRYRDHPEWFDGFGKHAPERDGANREATQSPRSRHRRGCGPEQVSMVPLRGPPETLPFDLARLPTLEHMAPPSPDELAIFLRLPKTLKAGQVARGFETAAEKLLSEVGFVEAFHRMANLPIDLPAPIIGAFGNRSLADQEALLAKLAEKPQTPLTRLRECRLLLATHESPPFAGRRGRDSHARGHGKMRGRRAHSSSDMGMESTGTARRFGPLHAA